MAEVATPLPQAPSSEPSEPAIRISLVDIAVNSVAGALLLLTNFPKFLMHMIDVNVTDPSWRASLYAPVQLVQDALEALIGDAPTDFFVEAMKFNFVLLMAFVVVLGLLSVRRRDLSITMYALVAIVAGYVALHLIAWAAVIVVVTVGGVLSVVGWIADAIAAITVFLWRHVEILAAAILGIAATVIVFVAPQVLLSILRFARAFGLYLAGAAAVLWLIVKIAPVIYEWIIEPIIAFFYRLLEPVLAFLRWLLWPIIQALLFVLDWLFLIAASLILLVVALILLAIMGNLLVAQIVAGWYAAHSRKQMILAGFAIGSAFALITLQCIATPTLVSGLNRAWWDALALLGMAPTDYGQVSPVVTDLFQFCLPTPVADFAFAYLTNLKAPALDSLVLLTTAALALASASLKLTSSHPAKDEPVPATFVAKDLCLISFGLFGLVFLIFASAVTGDSKA